MQKQADLTVALNTIARIEQRLSFAFLLNSAIQAGTSGRDRVTAEEIKMVAQELESGLGGIYSILSVELQLPLVNRKMALMERQGRLPKLPKDVVKPQITTGLDALGRGNDKAKLIEFLQTIAGTLGPEVMAKYVNSRELITRLAASDGLDTYKLIKSDEDLMAEEQQQAMMMQQQMAAQDPNNDPAKQAALVKAENDSIRANQEVAAFEEASRYVESTNPNGWTLEDLKAYRAKNFPRLHAHLEANKGIDHQGFIFNRLKEGKPVPARVLLAEADALEFEANAPATATKDPELIKSNEAYRKRLRAFAAQLRDAAQPQNTPAKAPESVSPGVQEAEGSTAGVAAEYKPAHHVAVYSGKAVMSDGTRPKSEEFRSAAMRVSDNAGDGFVIAPDGSVWVITKSSKRAKPANAAETAEAVAIARNTFDGQASGAKKADTAGVAAEPAQKQPKARTQAQQRADAKKRDAVLQDLVYGTPGTVIEKRGYTDTVVSYDKKQGTVVVSRTEDGRNMGQFTLMGGLDKRDVISITAPDGTVLYDNRKLTDAAKERVEAMLAPTKAKKPAPNVSRNTQFPVQETMAKPETSKRKKSFGEAVTAMLAGDIYGNRAKAGGEVGINDKWYKGGQFLPVSLKGLEESVAKAKRKASGGDRGVEVFGRAYRKLSPAEIPIIEMLSDQHGFRVGAHYGPELDEGYRQTSPPTRPDGKQDRKRIDELKAQKLGRWRKDERTDEWVWEQRESTKGIVRMVENKEFLSQGGFNADDRAPLREWMPVLEKAIAGFDNTGSTDGFVIDATQYPQFVTINNTFRAIEAGEPLTPEMQKVFLEWMQALPESQRNAFGMLAEEYGVTVPKPSNKIDLTSIAKKPQAPAPAPADKAPAPQEPQLAQPKAPAPELAPDTARAMQAKQAAQQKRQDDRQAAEERKPAPVKGAKLSGAELAAAGAKARAEKSLQKTMSWEGGDGANKYGTVQNWADDLMSRGYRPLAAEVIDQAAVNRAEKIVKNPRSDRWGYISPEAKAEIAEAKQVLANRPTKIEYRAQSPDRSFYDITKAQYDYMASKVAPIKSEPAPKPEPPKSFTPNPNVKDLPHQRFWEFTPSEMDAYKTAASREGSAYGRQFDMESYRREETKYYAERFPNLAAYEALYSHGGHKGYLMRRVDDGEPVDLRVLRELAPDVERRATLLEERGVTPDDWDYESTKQEAEEYSRIAQKIREAIANAQPKTPETPQPTQEQAPAPKSKPVAKTPQRLRYNEVIAEYAKSRGGSVFDGNSPTGRIAAQDAFKQVQKEFPWVRTFGDLDRQAPDILASPSKPAKSKDTITVDGKERPRTNSNGKPIHPTEEGTRAFWRWFGDSKVVDERGRPLVVYHGSPDMRFMGEDATFKSQAERFGGRGESTHAHWFASDTRTAKSYADDRRAYDYQNAEPGVIPAYLQALNPLVIDAQGQYWRDAQRRGQTADVIDEARADGHDGVIIRNVKDDYNNSKATKPTTTLTVFNPTQIKSATGNQGTFSPDNPSILASPSRVRRGAAPKADAQPATASVPSLTPAPAKATPDPRAEARKEAKSGGHLPQIEGWSVPEPKTPAGDLNTIRMALDRVFPRHTYGRNRKGTKGTFNLRTGFTMVGYVSDSVTRVHELAHQIEGVYELFDGADADTLSLIDAELGGDAFGQTVPDNASLEVERSERFAEWLTAYIEEPAGAAMLAPTVLKVMVERVPAQARAAIDEFSSQVQGYRNLPPEQQMALRIQDPTARKTFVETVRGWFANAFQSVGADGAAPDMAVHRTKAIDGVWRAAVTNTRAPIEGAVLRLAEMQGFTVEGQAVRGMGATPDDDLLNSPLHYIASYPYLVEMTKAMVEGGLKNLRNETYSYNGEPLSVVSLLNTLTHGQAQLKSAYAYMFAQRFESLKGRWTAEEQAALEERQAAREAKAKAARTRKERRLTTQMNFALSEMQANGKTSRQIAAERVKREAEIAKELDALDAKNAKKLASDLKKDYARTRQVLRQRFENMGLTPGETLEQIEAAQKAIMADFNSRPEAWKKEVQDFAAQYRAIGDASLDVLVGGGLMTQQEADEVRRNNPYWISARRVRATAAPQLKPADETSLSESGASQFFQKTALTGADDGINQFKGSQANIQDPVVSLMQNIFEAYRAAYINKSVGGLVALAEGAGPGAGMFEDITGTVKADSTVANYAPGETVRVYRQVPVKDAKGKIVRDEAGEPVMKTKEFRYVVLDPGMQRAFRGVSRQFGVPDIPALQVALRVMTLPKRLLQWGVVVTPMFKVFNVIRDTAERVVGGRHDRAFYKVFSTRPLNEYEYRSMGIGIERGGILGDRNDYQNMMTSVMRSLNPKNTALVKAGAPFRWMNNVYFGKFSVWSESVNRTIEYNAAFEKAKQMGMSDPVAKLWAAGEARSTGTDFARHGAVTAFFDMFIPFLNPAVQGQATFWTKAAENPGRFMARLVMYAMIGAGLEELWALKDGTSAARRDLPPYMRYMFWNFHIKDDKWLRIPKGHELGAILALGEEARRGAAGEEMNLPGVGRSMFQTMSPVSDSDIYGPLTTLIQWNANRDFFTGNTIVPEWESKRAMELRDFENSSPMAKLLAQITKKDARLWDMAINETFGTVGAIATDASRLAGPDELPMSDRLAGLGGRVFGVVSRQTHTQAPAVVEVRSIMDSMGSQDVMRPFRTAYHVSPSAAERERRGRMMIEEAERILPRLRRITERTPRNDEQLKAVREQISELREEVKFVAESRFGADAIK